MNKKEIITVQGTEIMLFAHKKENYISLTDMAKHKDSMEPSLVISHWMSTRYTVEYMGVWEMINNPDFKPTEFGRFKSESGSNGFVLTPKRWTEATGAIGIFSKAGRYGGGTFAHKDIAFEFGSWLSAEFKYLLIREFDRLKSDEQRRLSLEWNLQRTLSKINYRIHTDAIKEEIIPKTVTGEQAAYVYDNEADLLNVALFGKTAAQWRAENPENKGNIRDMATLEQLVVLSNMESINALLIRQGLPQGKRLIQLNRVAITQMKSLLDNQNLSKRLNEQ
jgi:hypothetical protein